MFLEDIPRTRNIINELAADPDDNNFTELHIAVYENRVSEVEKLIQNKTAINAQTKNGITSLLLACFLPVDTTIPKILISSGADVNLSDDDSTSPLLAACKTQKVEIVELLLKSGANINHQENNRYNFTALHYAIGHLQLVDLLLQSGADTSLADCDGCNPLMRALVEHEDCAAKILPFTQDLNVVDCDGCSAIMWAACSLSNMSKDIIIRLIEQGADVNIHVDGFMPIILSLGRRDPTIFECLWDRTDIEVLLKEVDLFYRLIEIMISSDWITPSKIQYFYKVLDTPGVELNGDYLGTLLSHLESLVHRDEFLSIDVCGIVNKLLEKNVELDDPLIIERYILHYRFTFDIKRKLLQIFIDNNANLNSFNLIRMSVDKEPELTVLLLPYCISNNPVDILKYFASDVNRMDIPMLKLIKSILRLCTPSFKLRNDCIKFMYILAFPNQEEDKIIGSELFNEVEKFLCTDRLPTLKELSRDAIRNCLASKHDSTKEYLRKLNMLHLPKSIADIIQCKSVVCDLE